MSTVFSADGTAIGFDAWGDGPPLIMIDGATAYRAMSPIAAQVGALLRDDFRTYAYDRRGRGESGDTPPYEVQREIEDVAALIDEAGGWRTSAASPPARSWAWRPPRPGCRSRGSRCSSRRSWSTTAARRGRPTTSSGSTRP